MANFQQGKIIFTQWIKKKNACLWNIPKWPTEYSTAYIQPDHIVSDSKGQV